MIEGRHELQKILRNMGWLIADKIIRMGIGLFVGIWLARYLGPHQFGLLNYATAFVALFATVSSLGLEGIVVRDIVRGPSSSDNILGSAFILRLIGGFLAIALSVSCALLGQHTDGLTLWLIVIIATGTIFQAVDTIDYWFQSQILSKFTVIAKNIAFLLAAFLKIILIILKASLIAIAIAGLLEIFLGAIGLIIAYKSYGKHLKSWTWEGSCAKSLLKDSWLLIISGTVVSIYMKIDQIMLEEMIGNTAVGIYSAAVKISEVWYFIPGTIIVSVFPAIIQAKLHDRNLYLQRVQYLYAILIWSALAVAIPLTFLAPRIIVRFFGQEYAVAGSVLSLHIWTAVFSFYGSGKTAYMQIENMQLFALLCTSLGAIVNIFLNIIFIKQYGIVGAAIATLCAQVTATVVVPIFYKKDRISVKLFIKSFYSLFELLPIKVNK